MGLRVRLGGGGLLYIGCGNRESTCLIVSRNVVDTATGGRHHPHFPSCVTRLDSETGPRTTSFHLKHQTVKQINK